MYNFVNFIFYDEILLYFFQLSNFAVEVQLQKKPLLISKNMKKIVDDYFHKLIINTSNFILVSYFNYY